MTPKPKEKRKRRRFLNLILFLLLIGCASLFWAKTKISNSLLRAELNRLDLIYIIWEQHGRPTGVALTNFLTDHPPYKAVMENFQIGGQEYKAIIKRANPGPRFSGAIYVTTNHVFILQPENVAITNIADFRLDTFKVQ